MNVLVIGTGAREHALSWKLSQSAKVKTVYTIPGNGGITNSFPDFNPCDFGQVEDFCGEKGINLIVVGPENILAEGIVDYFAGSKIKVFGPSKTASMLECSKIFAKEFMSKYKIATAKYCSFDLNNGDKILTDALTFCKELKYNCVVKYDGLAAGKGVFICSSIDEVKSAIANIAGNFGTKFHIEELLKGEEVSIIGITDSRDIRLFLPSQDHKQRFDGDFGPNTGGMGVIAPLDSVTKQILGRIYAEIVRPTLHGIQTEYFDYKGFIYFGVMLTEDGPKLLEYNVRMGDPEACVLLPSLKSNLYDIIEASLAGKLREHEFEFHEGYFTDVVLVADGYPAKYHKGNKIEIKTTQDSDTLIFHAGTKLVDNHLVSNGGRVLNIVSSGKTLTSSLMKVYKAIKAINFKGASKRCDIGRRNKTRLAILISGRGSNMEAIIKNCLYDDGILHDCAFPSVIISNCPTAKGLETAESYGIDTIAIESNNKTREIFEEELIRALAPYNPDFIILAGFDRILTSHFLSIYKDKVINIHPADTKEYKGLHGYKWAFENKLKETLITVHFVDEGIDTGKVIAKQKIDLSKAKSLDEVEEIGLKNEHELYSQAIRSLIRRD